MVSSDLGPELNLLMLCGPSRTIKKKKIAIEALLSDGIDWTLFARQAIAHGLTSIAAHTLVELASDFLPRDIADAFHTIVDETSRTNRTLFDELGRLLDVLATNGVEAIPLRGPVLAIQAYGQFGHRDSRKLELLIRRSDVPRSLANLSEAGYARDSDLDRKDSGREHISLLGRATGTVVELHTSLAPRDMALAIDYAAMWRRATRAEIAGQSVLRLTPEDCLLALVLHGGARSWSRLNVVFDVAGLITADPQLDWHVVAEYAHAHGCVQMLLLGIALVQRYLYTPIPDTLREEACANPNIATMVRHIAGVWQSAGATNDLPDCRPDTSDAKEWASYAERCWDTKNLAEATEASDRALSLDFDNIPAARVGIIARLCACDWQRRDEDERRVAAGIKAGRTVLTPFWQCAVSNSAADSLLVARLTGRGLMPPQLWRGERYDHDKVRIAYCSSDFRDHVVADVMAGCFEHHDRSGFEITAISWAPDDRSATRRRIVAAFDRFIDVRSVTDLKAARLIREHEVDIVIDLNGYSGNRRTGIFAHRPAPVQVVYQGYPGTMGLPFYDYIIADRFVIPPERQSHYSEQVVYLPYTYMPHDNTREITTRTPTRVEAGLPPRGFVFASHNNDYKLNPQTFDIWMRLLRNVEGSVLWLKSLNPWAMINLRREASARGITPDRIIFAPRLHRKEDHLARLRLADLFLDTCPYNAHATACDALWAGVPVLTCPGNTLPSRVAASLLYAVDLPYLIAGSLGEYEATAVALARDPGRLAQIKTRLESNRHVAPLFDTARFTRELEAAYIAMWTRVQDGLPSASFAVDPMVPTCATAT